MRKVYGKIKDDALRKRTRKKLSIRARITGSEERPRLCAIKTNKHLSVQVVNDEKSTTLFSLHTYGKNAVPGARKNKEGAKTLGVHVAQELKKRGIASVVFDRNGRTYHGVLAALADAIREQGIQL